MVAIVSAKGCLSVLSVGKMLDYFNCTPFTRPPSPFPPDLFPPPELVLNLLRKIHFGALKGAMKDLALDSLDDVEDVTEALKTDETFLRKIHHALFEVHVVDGFLVCPQSGRKFPVKDGIPNMLLHEDEV